MDVIFKETISEISGIDYLFEKYKTLFALKESDSPDDITIAAAGGVLHSFYNGVENLFKTINKATDNKIFTGEKTHSEMLEFMNTRTPERRQVITEDTKLALYEYMRFRHFYRHNYAFELVWTKLGPQVANCHDCWRKLKSETISFMQEHLENNVVLPTIKAAAKKTKGKFGFKTITGALDSNGKENLSTFFYLKKLDTQEQQEKVLFNLFTQSLKSSAVSATPGFDMEAAMREAEEDKKKESPSSSRSKAEDDDNHPEI